MARPVGGSSPLARGLREARLTWPFPARIIPARAGFTGRLAGRAIGDRDHPRSRGVYWSTCGSSHRRPGSSPLARGLPDRQGLRTNIVRIIPARAGFTSPRRGHRPRREDHPRSRGVYESLPALVSFGSGSSPLARGLRVSRRMRMGRAGIIPARAGFTSRTGPVDRPGGDHPRSRGVYAD